MALRLRWTILSSSSSSHHHRRFLSSLSSSSSSSPISPTSSGSASASASGSGSSPKYEIRAEDIPRHTWLSQTSQGPADENRAELLEILNAFNAPVKFAVAYGSGVKKQEGYTATTTNKQPMIDFIFGVTHPAHWHSMNIRQHRSHYSWLAFLGSNTVAKVQELGSGVYFNTLVPMNGKTIKYGVVNLDMLITELQEWNDLYLSGRFQKPITFLRDDARVYLANIVNRLNAIRVALLLLPETFSEEELFRTIAGISYTGDMRMAFAENPRKVENIVAGQLPEFRLVYQRLLASQKGLAVTKPGTYAQDVSPEARLRHLMQLPQRLQQLVINHYLRETSSVSMAVNPSSERRQVLEMVSKSDRSSHFVQQALATIISASSSVQTYKGFLSAGVTKSVRYAFDKWRKGRA